MNLNDADEALALTYNSLTKRQAVGDEEINTKIELMIQHTQVIENKIDNSMKSWKKYWIE